MKGEDHAGVQPTVAIHFLPATFSKRGFNQEQLFKSLSAVAMESEARKFQSYLHIYLHHGIN